MPALTLAVLVMRRSALSMRLVTVVLVLPGSGQGVVLVSAAALVILPLPVETCTVRGQGAAGAAVGLPRVTVRSRAAGLQCAHAVGGADRGGSGRPGRRSG